MKSPLSAEIADVLGRDLREVAEAADDLSCPWESAEPLKRMAASATDLLSARSKVTEAIVGTRVTRQALLEAAKLFHSFLNGLQLFDGRVHGMLLEIHLLGELERGRRGRARHNDNAIRVGHDDVGRIHGDAVAHHRDIGAREAVVRHRSGWNDAERVDWE